MFGELDVSGWGLALCAAAAVGGAMVQGVLGFGYALLVVPALLAVAPDAVPAAALIVALPMVLALAVGDREHVEWPAVGWMTLGRVPGTAVAAVVVARLGTDELAFTVGVLLLLAVAGTVARGRRAGSARLELSAGVASGFAGTVGALGGPYLGLALTDREGPSLRATISVAFAIGVVLSLVAVAAAGEVTSDAATLAAALVPATLLGLLLGVRLAGHVERAWLRPAVLTVAAAAGIAAMVRSLV